MCVNIIQFVGQTILTIVINLLAFAVFKTMYGAKPYKNIFFIAAYFVSVILMIIINRLGNPYINVIYAYVYLNVICLTLFESDIKKVWLHNLIIWLIYAVCDMGTVIVWSLFDEKTLQGILSDEQLMLCSNIMNIILLFLAFKLYLTFSKKLKFYSIKFKIAIFIVALTFFEIWIAINYANMISTTSGGIQMMIIIFGFVIVDIFLAYILNRVSSAFQYEYELNLVKQMQKLQLENYKETEQKYRESRAIIHDIKKHLDVAEELWGTDKSKAREYREHIDKQMDKIFCGFHCSNRILGIIMDRKMSIAQANGINVDVAIDEVNIDFIDDMDITAIFANLWDNAIEACEKVENNKYIKFYLIRYNDFVLIDVENSYNGVYEKIGNKFKSTKNQHEGIGLSSVSLSVNKYNGFVSVDSFEHTFKVEITIPIEK